MDLVRPVALLPCRGSRTRWEPIALRRTPAARPERASLDRRWSRSHHARSGSTGVGSRPRAAWGAESVIQFAISLVPRTDELDRVRELARTADADALDLVGIQEHRYVERTITRASEAYGTVALVIGLLSWFWLFSHLLLLAAEVNVGLRRRLWPRSLTGELGAADRSAPAGRGSDAAGQAAGDPRPLQRRP
jgi:hypothetical protein